MKPRRTETAKASGSKLNVNPTSAGTTVWEYAILIYLAASHLLTDNPRHIQYRESVKDAKKTTQDAGGRDASAQVKSTRSSSTYGGKNKDPQHKYHSNPPPKRSSQSPPYPSYRNDQAVHLHPVESHSTFDPTHPVELSKVQMRDAWARMRAVSRLRVEPVAMGSSNDQERVNEKVRKHVRWGPVQTYEHEHQYQYQDDDDDDEVENDHDHGAALENAETGRKWQASDKRVVKGQNQGTNDRVVGKELEIWDSANTGGEHEIWGPTIDNTF
ncbi:uncharacterized protein K460DRAFT_402740 [Cucurbitaria berberidis CBS 394.84]|uniref:Uncharacterized protein n=1 Tax=Cucurbitaria berberidis CBS 394.84 TaxID=1168544 RepID=A0A9P4GKQ4_9PLEO|nr:uncharacterized protein K460DRAFT_402740 [Cucurbitaria berberidis CBS 394.84]KAF1847380.1 hypothetical protein K460DRAFT_402740 [Cucurbitaria berberidis CBS 394.84]